MHRHISAVHDFFSIRGVDHVVGYQDIKDGVQEEKILLGATFQKIDGSKATIGDFVPNADFASGQDALVLLNSQGGTKGRYVYIGDDLVETVRGIDDMYASFSKGWYVEDDWINFVDNIGDLPEAPSRQDSVVELENGEAILTQPGTTGGGFVFNGQVANEDNEVKGNSGEKTFRCNCSPVKITIGQIEPNALFGSGQDALVLLNPQGGTKNRYVYIGDDLVETVRGIDDMYASFSKGWYVEDDWIEFVDNIGDLPEAPTSCNDTVEFNPGAGFYFQPGEDNGGLVIPSAL